MYQDLRGRDLYFDFFFNNFDFHLRFIFPLLYSSLTSHSFALSKILWGFNVRDSRVSVDYVSGYVPLMSLSDLDLNDFSDQSSCRLPGERLRILIQNYLCVWFSVTEELRDLISLIFEWSIVIPNDPYQLLFSHVVQVGGVTVKQLSQHLGSLLHIGSGHFLPLGCYSAWARIELTDV